MDMGAVARAVGLRNRTEAHPVSESMGDRLGELPRDHGVIRAAKPKRGCGRDLILPLPELGQQGIRDHARLTHG